MMDGVVEIVCTMYCVCTTKLPITCSSYNPIYRIQFPFYVYFIYVILYFIVLITKCKRDFVIIRFC